MSVMSHPALSPLAALARHPVSRWLGANGPALAILVMAALIAWQVAGVILQLLPTRADSSIAGVASSRVDPQQIDGVQVKTDVAPIVDAHLFGVASVDDESAPSQELVTDAPVTTLALTLRGTLAAGDDEQALAIIADGREENVFRIQESVRRGVTLHAVQRTQVILNVNGALEALRLPEQESAQVSPARQASAGTLTRSAPSVTEVLTNNASRLTEVISPRPYFVGGQQRGYRVYPGKDRRQFQQLGLRPGDIVTAINGTALTNPTEGARIFSSLGDASSVTVTLERNGSPQTITLDVAQLDLSNQAR